MTAVPDTSPAETAPGADGRLARLKPYRPAGLELLGEFRGSGSRQAPSLVRRSDGQVLQLSPLVYGVVEALDGRRNPAGIAAAVSARTGRELDADGVMYLLEHKLAPLGLVAAENAGTPPQAKPLLAIRGRRPLLGAATTDALALALQPLFRLPVVLAAVATLVLLDVWLLAVHGLGAGVRQLVSDPVLALVVLALTLAAAVFHECGHAAGCRFGGGRPGEIGVGVYLVYPAFYTDVTDAYRLGRAARLRTDLGGLYFHALACLLLAGAYVVTGAEWLLLAVLVIQLEMAEQLMPLIRYDGYYILADLVGVPDLFGRIGPVLRSAVRRRGPRDPRVVGLKRWVRVTVTVWVAFVVPFLLISLALIIWHLPRLVSTLAVSGGQLLGASARALADGDLPSAVGGGVSALLLLLMVSGVAYILQGVTRRVVAAAGRWSGGKPRRRAGVVAGAAVLVGSLVASWVATGQFSTW